MPYESASNPSYDAFDYRWVPQEAVVLDASGIRFDRVRADEEMCSRVFTESRCFVVLLKTGV